MEVSKRIVARAANIDFRARITSARYACKAFVPRFALRRKYFMDDLSFASCVVTRVCAHSKTKVECERHNQ